MINTVVFVMMIRDDVFLARNLPISPFCDDVRENNMACSLKKNALARCNLKEYFDKLDPEYQASSISANHQNVIVASCRCNRLRNSIPRGSNILCDTVTFMK